MEAESPAAKFRAAIDLATTGIALKRQQLARAHPSESGPEIDARLRHWLLDRPLDAPTPAE